VADNEEAHEEEQAEQEHRIVVGVEGSGGAKAALRWAIQTARYRGGYVEVVTAYSHTYVPASPDFNYVPIDPVDLEAEVEKMQASVVDEVLAEANCPDIDVRRVILRGRPADTLIKAAHGADMLVVGSRGRGGFRGLLLGSVSQQIAQHGDCPVVIVRPDLLC
jgi:nucleotide-binding universal stress UspA family protein